MVGFPIGVLESSRRAVRLPGHPPQTQPSTVPYTAPRNRWLLARSEAFGAAPSSMQSHRARARVNDLSRRT